MSCLSISRSGDQLFCQGLFSVQQTSNCEILHCCAAQSPLEARDHELLSGVGICSGDLLWVTSSASSLQQTVESLEPATATQHASAARQPASPANNLASLSSDASSSRQPSAPSRCQSLPEDVPMPDADEQSNPVIRSGTLQNFEDLLQTTLHASCIPNDQPNLPTAAVHAAMLNREFRPSWCPQVDS